MERLYSLLFLQRTLPNYISIYLLIVRLIMGVLLLQHAVLKIVGTDTFQPVYVDAFGLGVSHPLAFVLCMELFCGFSFLIGFMIRIFIVPMFLIAVYYVFLGVQCEQYALSELAFVYVIVFVSLFIVGSGRYSLDYYAHSCIHSVRFPK